MAGNFKNWIFLLYFKPGKKTIISVEGFFGFSNFMGKLCTYPQVDYFLIYDILVLSDPQALKTANSSNLDITISCGII